MKIPAKSRYPRMLAKLRLAFFSVILTLLVLEIAIRIICPQDLGYWDSRPFRRLTAEAPHYVENIPDTGTNFIGVPIHINSLGMRGEEIAIPKPPKTVRILAVGDSITFGYGIRLEDTYAKVLERRLNQESVNGTSYEVLNGGTLGGSLADYLHFLTRKVEILQPDTVVVGLCLNDIQVYSDSGTNFETGVEWQGQQRPLAHRLNLFWLRHSQLYMLIYPRVKVLMYSSGVLDINKVRGDNFVAVAPPSDYQTRAWKSSLEMLRRLNSFCNEHHYRLVVVLFPMQMQMSDRDMRFYREKYHLKLGDGALAGDPQRRLHEFSSVSGIAVIDLLPVYRAYDSKDLYFSNKMIPSDAIHPSVKGNEVAADEIFRILRSAESSPANTKPASSPRQGTGQGLN